ncbi:MAG TPA: ABC transporter ATP-binding protein [Anaerolineaceae bacterium]|nr:ABC transporter ATP-binding protein [Anaerolineaceae bacterium]HQF61171.1 ABC transporter ATP-binding protein [Anaerolineaceae bacterium]HQH84312.1 ABC transporter ATP-binding protein [Anaerolineaceae bacterium]
MNPIVQVEKLRKTYGTTVAVDEISFSASEGEIFGMVGPNGAGKTTTIECLEGLRKPDAGLVRVLGVDPQVDSQTLRLRTGMQLQQSNLPDRMKVWEALDLYAAFYPHAVNWEDLLAQLGLEEKRNAPFAKLSGGQKQRLFIALALLPDPQVVFLDELITGLDPQARRAIWDLVSDVRARGKTVLLTTHFMEEAERLCDRVAILDHGRIVAMDSPANLIRGLGAEENVVFCVDAPLPAAFTQALSNTAQVEVLGERVTVHAKSGRPVPLVSEVVSLLTTQGILFRDLRTEQPTLEDVFLSLTGRKMRE